jgi:methionine-rich copper-binding protein CopC
MIARRSTPAGHAMRESRFSRRAVLLSAAALLVAGPRPARAHAIISESTPKAGATVAGPDIGITIRYNNRIDRARSRLSLLDASDKATKLPISEKGPPDTLLAEAKGLADGAYRLRWQVLAVDGHITRGEIPFKVGAA